MSLITENPSTAGNATFTTRTKFAKYLFVVSGTTGNYANPTAILTALDSAKIKLEKQLQTAVQRINDRPLTDIIEIATLIQGEVKGYISGGRSYLEFTIEIANGGCARVSEKTYFTLFLTAMPANLETNIFAVDSIQDAATELVYDTVKVFSESSGFNQCASASLIAVPKATIKRLELKLPNGESVVYLPAELSRLCDELNGDSYNMSGVVTEGARNFYILPIDVYGQFKADVTADSTVYLVKHVIAQ
jgi:hypothetical protein